MASDIFSAAHEPVKLHRITGCAVLVRVPPAAAGVPTFFVPPAQQAHGYRVCAMPGPRGAWIPGLRGAVWKIWGKCRIEPGYQAAPFRSKVDTLLDKNG